MNALAMVQRCGAAQRGERPSEWTLRATRSSEAVAVASQEYVPEAEVVSDPRPLPDVVAGEWA